MKKKSQIALNKRTYPLYVGGSAAANFRDFDGKGSSVVLEATVNSQSFGVEDIIWDVEDAELADFEFNGEMLACGQRRVRARRTGMTKVYAKLPDGAVAECILTIIDHYSRLTVAEIVLNTDALHLQTGDSTQLLPILYPKDLFQNGMLNTQLIWESMDETVAVVTDGKIKALGKGETDIVVRSVDVNRVARCHVTVASEAGASSPKQVICEEIREMSVGEQLQLPAQGKHIVWQSDNRYVVDVDNKGCVTAGSVSSNQQVDATGMIVTEVPQQVWIYATDVEGGNITKYPIHVKKDQIALQYIVMSMAECSIPVGESQNVTVALSHSAPRQGQVLWESSNKDVLSIVATEDTIYGTAQAIITAKEVGEAIVTASFEGKTDSCLITVTKEAVKVDEIRMEKYLEINVDQVYQIFPRITKLATNKKLYWVGTDDSVATVDREGNVMGYCPGECKLYAIAEDSLSMEQRAYLKKSRLEETFSPDSQTFQEILENAIYSECVLKVRVGSVALRNLHVVKESVTDHSVLLLWNRASLLDTGEFDHYIVKCNGVVVAATKKLGYRAEGLTPKTEYRFHVSAIDRNGEVIAEAEVGTMTADASPIINVLDYGAAGDGSRLDTYFIQKAINECPIGGTVLLPQNHVFVSGALFLKSNMTFRVDGILMGSTDPKDYPRVVTRWEGWRKLEQPAEEWANTTSKVPVNHCPHASLLNAGCYDEGENSCLGPYNLENLVICGKGQINANGFSLAYNEGPNINGVKLVSKEYPIKDATSRGSAIRIHNGKNVYVKDVQVAYAPGWTIHTIYCEHITFDGMEVVSQGDGDCGFGTSVLDCGHMHNGDGIDPESCVHTNLFDILFTTGDDAVAIKSGRGKEGNELDKPNAYIRITDCVSKWSLGGFGTGSETASGSHDLLFQNLEIEDILVSGIWIKTCPERGGLTEHIQVRDMIAGGCKSPVWIFNTYTSTSVQANPSLNKPIVRHLTFENVHGKENNELGFVLDGSSECMIQDVHFRGCTNGGRDNRVVGCENVSGV